MLSKEHKEGIHCVTVASEPIVKRYLARSTDYKFVSELNVQLLMIVPGKGNV